MFSGKKNDSINHTFSIFAPVGLRFGGKGQSIKIIRDVFSLKQNT